MNLKTLFYRVIGSVFGLFFASCGLANAYPIFAQQAYRTPRERNGRIVCANCHLALKPVELEVPQAILPNEVFGATVRIPYDRNVKQVAGNGKLGDLNVGAVIILPNGFRLAPQDLLSREIKDRVGKLYFQPYSADQESIVVVGPVPGKTYQEMTFPIIAPDPTTTKDVHFLKYPVYLGGNRGRGQVYPDGSKSNNTVFNASASGVITQISPGDKGRGAKIVLETSDGRRITELVPAGPELLVKVGQSLNAGDPLTNNPNVGGFGQAEGEIVLQDPRRIQRFCAFGAVVFVTQVLLVLKKKQFEKVQLSEINFSSGLN